MENGMLRQAQVASHPEWEGGMLAGIEWGAMKAAQVNEKAKGAS